MWRLIFYVVVLILAVWVGLILKHDPGYVLIAYKHWTVETSLWFSLIFLLIAFFIFYYFMRFFSLLIKSHGHVIRWYRQKQFIKAHTITGAGLLALEEAEWQDAEALLLRGAKSSGVPVVNYLNAARAAQQQFAYNRRDKYLQQAAEIAEGKERIAVQLTQANLQIQHEQYTEALLVLEDLIRQKPKHPYVLKLLQRVYLGLKQYDQLSELLPVLRKRKILNPVELQELASATYGHLFTATHKEISVIKKLWRDLPKEWQAEPKITSAYVKQLISNHEDNEAESIIIDSIKQQFSEELIKTYGQLHAFHVEKRKKRVQGWLKLHGERVMLLNLLATLAIEENDFDEAKQYAERAILLEDNLESYGLLLKASEHLGDTYTAHTAKEKLLESTGVR